MGIIGSRDVYNILRKSFSILNRPLTNHGERTAYILYKMLQFGGKMSNAEVADYIMLAILHDIGTCRLEYKERWQDFETEEVWPHSIYGFLFLKYLSPLSDKAEVVLYHHLDYNKHHLVKSDYMTIAEYLFLADKMDVMMSMPGKLEEDYFKKNYNTKFSGEALDLFRKADEKYGILNKLQTLDYITELEEAIANAHFSEKYKNKLLHMLIYIIDFRSECTVLHTMATTTFAYEIGQLMRLSSQEKYNLYYGALLHDIGKIAIPINILEAPRKLNDKEVEIMQAHVRVTENILNGLVSDEVREIAISHHEKLDGSGYYRGLKGKELNKLQRIVAVADIISALYGKRSYKEAFDLDVIRDILLEEAANDKLCSVAVDFAVRNMEAIVEKFETEKENILGTYMQIKQQEKEIYEQFKKF